jgi:multiple antibiotic resistance protein
MLKEFVTLFVVIDPIGTLPVLYFVTAHAPRKLHAQIAIRAVAIATLVLLLFLAGGQLLIESLGLRFGSFQIAGGIVLFLFAITMILGDSKPVREIGEAERDHLEGAVFPLAIPSLASPGAMLAVVVLTDNHRNSILEQATTAGILVGVMAVTLVILLVAVRLKQLIGNSAASVISRVMGMVLATVAIDSIFGGLEALGLLTLPQ